MYIILHLYLVNHSWSFKILNFQMYILWIFKILDLHILKIVNVFLVVIFFTINLHLINESFEILL
jgi:hypothetical protein